jgi:hypothetical protein
LRPEAAQNMKSGMLMVTGANSRARTRTRSYAAIARFSKNKHLRSLESAQIQSSGLLPGNLLRLHADARKPLIRLAKCQRGDLDFVPPDLEFVPSGLDFVPENLDFVPLDLEIRHRARMVG